MAAAKELGAPYDLVQWVAENGKLPVVNFAAGGVATPADAALMMQLGADGVFVGSGIFKSGDPARRARAIVQAVTHYNDPAILAEVSRNLGEAMVGINISALPQHELLAVAGLVGEFKVTNYVRLSCRNLVIRNFVTSYIERMKIGVLALQGAFREHSEALREAGGGGRRGAAAGAAGGAGRADYPRRGEHRHRQAGRHVRPCKRRSGVTRGEASPSTAPAPG